MIMEHIYHSETLYFTTNLSLVLFFSLGLGVAVLAIGLAFRALVSYLAVLGTDLSFKERLFIPIAWLPKATVQVSIVLITTEFNPIDATFALPLPPPPCSHGLFPCLDLSMRLLHWVFSEYQWQLLSRHMGCDLMVFRHRLD